MSGRLSAVWRHAVCWVRTRLFPPSCFVCGRLLDLYDSTEREGALCSSCSAEWARAKREICTACGKEISFCSCQNPLLEDAGCRTLRRLVFYRSGVGDPVQNRLIYRFKYRRSHRTADFLARELSGALRDLAVQEGLTCDNTVLVPIPRSRRAYRLYGTDQAEELAAALSRCCGFPRLSVFQNTGHRLPKQKELTAEARVHNARRAYRVREKVPIKGKYVVLLDDVVTTGATASACARKLKRRGVKGIFCFAIASDDL